MNNQQLQDAIDKYVKRVVEDGTKLQQYQPHFYDKLVNVTVKMMYVQAERASFYAKPVTILKGDA